MRWVYAYERTASLQDAEIHDQEKIKRAKYKAKAGGSISMKTISFSSIKGGTGKSSNSIMMANFLAQAGKKVLCIDMDIQNSMTFYYADDPEKVEGHSIAEALHQGCIEENIILTSHKNISLIPSSFKLVNLKTISTRTLSRLLKSISKQFDYCIIDTAPTWDNITLNALEAANTIVTPINMTQWDWKGAIFFRDQIIQDLGEDMLDRWNLLINAWKAPRTDNPENLINQLQNLFNETFDNILPVKIPEVSLIKKYIDTGEIITLAKEKEKLFVSVQSLSMLVTGESLEVEAF